MIGHRGQGFKDLCAKVQPQLQQLLYTKQLVYISTSSAWGVMEGAVRNLVQKEVLNCMCGAFSDKWFDVSKSAASRPRPTPTGRMRGSYIRAEKRSTKSSPAVNSMRSHLHPQRNLHRHHVAAGRDHRAQEKISRRHVHRGRRRPADRAAHQVLDEASASTCCLPERRRPLRLPPGLAVFAASPAALAKAAAAKDRGYYFDFLEFQKNAEQSMTPSTPSISHGGTRLSSKLDEFFAEGLEARYASVT